MKEIKITSNGIKQAIDDLVDENERLQDKVYKLEDIIKEAREYIEHYETIRGYYEYEEDGYDEYNYEEDLKQELSEILDKENKQ